MPKRKVLDNDVTELFESPELVIVNKKKRPKLIIEQAPPVNNIKDLIAIGKTLKIYKNIDNVTLWQIIPYLEELDKMVGMNSLKETVFYQVLYYLQNMHSRNKNQEYLHTIITGNAGCGKTTIAKIMGKLYTNLGVLSKRDNTFTIGYRDDFVAEYVGQTAVKTRKFLESCLGGVLFIDEVYALGPGQKDKDSFSKEAIDTINVFLSEHKNDFCCIVAGYKDEIKRCFFSVNQGLERRFPWRHDIEEYSEEDLYRIFIKMIDDTKWELTEEVTKQFIIQIIKDNRDLFKHTGGSIETFISKLKMIHSKRVFPLEKEVKFKFTIEDLDNCIKEVRKHSEKKAKVNYDYYT
jgi:SpoVK/Ycf46/Vps4 family AAA+-type ATPase